MADTIITNTPDSKNDAMGGMALVIIVAIVVVGAVILYQRGVFGNATGPATSETTEVNVRIPTPTPTPSPTPAPTE